MDNVFAVYKTDAHHSYASRDLIGMATSHENAINLVKRQVMKELSRLDSIQLFNLRTINQTQGYSGDGEFQLEELSLDTLY